jgi:HicB family
MELSDFTAKLRGELTSITRFAGEDVTRAAELLTEALDSSVRLILLDVLSAAAADITARLSDTVVEVRLADGEPTFVVMTAPPEAEYEEQARPAAAGGDQEPGARLTLRLPDSLKTRIEAAAARNGVSVNTWLVRAASRSVEEPARGSQAAGRWGPGQRITGYARS